MYGANEAALETDSNFPRFVRITDISEDGSLRPETFKSLPSEIAKPYLLREGDILLARSGATVGKTFIYRKEWGKACFAGYLIRFSCNRDLLLPDFLFSFTQSHVYWYQVRAGTIQATIQNFSAEKYGEVLLPLPPLDEQCAIAIYLDRETTRLDALIEKKQRQIELLQEKRVALISRAVTKGIDPNAKMKDSGIEWLEEIPTHWEVKRVKRLGSIRYGLGEPPEYVDDGLPFIRATDIKSGKIYLDTVKKVRPDDVPWSRNPSLNLHEILVVRSGAYTGDSALVTEDTAGAIAGYDMVLTASKAYAPFVAWVLLSKYMLQGQIYLERLRAAQPHLNAEELGEFVVVIPPYADQSAIVAYLDRETTRIDTLIEKVEKSIALLREYRISLISAAVTGKIDVRKEPS